MNSGEAIRSVIKDKLSELIQCTLLNLDMCNTLLQENVLERLDFEHLTQLTVRTYTAY